MKGNKTNVLLKKKGAPYWVRIPENKLTAGSPIEAVPLPERVIIPLQQHMGTPCQALVKKGDRVLTGQKIGDSADFLSAPVHASMSGEISDTITLVDPRSGQTGQALVLTSDGQDRWVELKAVRSADELSTEGILRKIREAGIVGMGGAVAPAHAKLSPSQDKKIDTVILNGCECEPYLTSDHRVMLEYGEQVLSGLNIIMKVLCPDNVYIAIEDNKADAIDHLAELITTMGFEKDFKVVPIKSRYPSGAREILIKVLLGREIPINGRARDIGVVVHNVSTAKAIHDAVIEGKPLIEEVITVTGAVKMPKNLLVRIGIPIRNLIEYCGGMDGNAGEIILGGPMMGVSQVNIDAPVTKGNRCLLAKEPQPIRERECIRCGRCLEVCPVRLAPTLLAQYAKVGRYEDCQRAYIDDCLECGACSYVCPANIPLLQYIKVAKRELARRAARR